MRKLIIVCEDKCKKYGDFLAQLISADDDTDDEIVGTKDGEVAAQVWSEKEYNANSAQLSSNQYILFIGSNKLIKDKSSHMDIAFDEYGIKYGWLGKQAALSVDHIVDVDDYDSFIEFAKNYQKNMVKVIELNDKKPTLIKNDTVKKIRFGALVAAAPVPLGVDTVKKFIQNSKIKEQQYSCAIIKFYLDDLSNFLRL